MALSLYVMVSSAVHNWLPSTCHRWRSACHTTPFNPSRCTYNPLNEQRILGSYSNGDIAFDYPKLANGGGCGGCWLRVVISYVAQCLVQRMA